MTKQTENSTANPSQPLLERWQQVCQQINQACTNDVQTAISSQDRMQQGVTLLAVSKTKPAEMIKTLAQAGQYHFGENYLQEAIEKMAQLKNDGQLNESKVAEKIIWHYIGHIQRNKTRDIAENFAWVHTLERQIIAKRLNNQRPDGMPPLNVLIQVNIDKEDSKSGCMPEDVESLVASIKDYERLTLRGLMIIPAVDNGKTDEQTNAFVRTKKLFAKVANTYPELKQWDTLSMGMSGDMTEAIAAGSTMVRVGSAIFGARE